ncbi:sulfurtransferase [Mycolicibacter heraklionensis]|uniref:Sulfurtransferase n=1 Tax=Mycolicibacter heraklionensis TaxID=512402 RepID=A0A9X7WK57_9MYCO|nr:rhodanese-like domain-containing protein [Mycolicibacter heraklionensis]QZA08770.1 sulfurtransferase [Mycolicibacter heraklionensis]
MTTTHVTSRIDHMLESARAKLHRLTADEVPEALRNGAYLVDIRPAAQRAAEGEVPGALVIERNVLEWRCDPTSDARLPQAVDDDVQWIILCSQGYTSSLAAAALQDLGLHRATDVIGGYQALAAVGELVEPAPLAALSVGVQQGAESFSFLRGPRRWM